MSNEKYYVPSIEEFYIGFEYEDKKFRPVKTKMGVVKNRIFGETTLSNNTPFWQIEQDIKDGDIRVKYLDKDDFKDVGLVRDIERCIGGHRDCFVLEGVDNFYTIEYVYDYKSLRITRMDKDKSSEHNVRLFDGMIKNKSELKKLLKQLNIK